MKEEIRQDGRTILSSEDGFSIRMFFNNLSGKNFSGKEYRDYVRNIAFGEMGFRHVLLHQDLHLSKLNPFLSGFPHPKIKV